MTSGSLDSVGAGLLVVDKPAGLTSHDVVARVRRLARTRKVGHAGTLDPMATGVLVLGLGRGTRLLGHLSLAHKSYDATVRLGATTTTDDAEGEVVATTPVGRRGPGDRVDEAAVRAALGHFVGELAQVPSAVSAVKVEGRRAYERVRSGEQVELAPRQVTVHELLVRAVRHPEDTTDVLDVEIGLRCSSGTYVRAIARDLGAALGVGGHLTALRRTAVGPVSLAEATPLAELEAAGTVPAVPLAEAVPRFFETLSVDADRARAVGFGRPLEAAEQPSVAATGTRPIGILGPDGAFLALYERRDADVLTPVAVFV